MSWGQSPDPGEHHDPILSAALVHTAARVAQVTPWVAAAAALHERVRAVAFDRVTARLVELHAPVDQGEEQPVCCGCDQAGRSDPPAMWPCRTYTLLAASVLGLGSGGVEEELTRLRTVPHMLTDRSASGGGGAPGGSS
ncbi:MAG: hypothetical protein HYR62_01125 [Actinobacteria bacterium]|nr:hypothetical protein [Actinomycetota bacterium]MBI3686662.1 hypothetical protein [Actinomycetota bacterium]